MCTDGWSNNIDSHDVDVAVSSWKCLRGAGPLPGLRQLFGATHPGGAMARRPPGALQEAQGRRRHIYYNYIIIVSICRISYYHSFMNSIYCSLIMLRWNSIFFLVSQALLDFRARWYAEKLATSRQVQLSMWDTKRQAAMQETLSPACFDLVTS